MILLAGENKYQEEICEALVALGYTKEQLLVNIHAQAIQLPTRSTLLEKLKPLTQKKVK